MNQKKIVKKAASFVLAFVLFLIGILSAPITARAAGWPDYAKDLVLGNAVSGSMKDGDYYGKFNDSGSACYWHIYRFTMPTQGHLNIHVEAANSEYLNKSYSNGTSSYQHTYYTIFPALSPDSFIWNYKFGNSSYSSAREMYYNSVEIALDGGEYYFAVRAYKKLDEIYYLTLSYQEPRFPVTSISFDKPKLKMEAGTQQEIHAAVLPDNATDKTLVWKSTAPSVATVKNGVIDAVSAGTASIIASSADGEISAVCEVTVTALPGDYEYRVLEDDSAEIAKYTAEDKNTSVPAQIGGRNVTSIGDYAFQNSSGLAGVELPEGLTAVGRYSFQNCSNLLEINLPEGMTRLGDYAFQNCESLAEAKLPGKLKEIGGCAFQNCSGLKAVELPEGMTVIGRSSFSSCSGLENVGLPESLTAIGDYAFYGCSSLSEVGIPEHVENIGQSAFGKCADGLTLVVDKGSYAESYAKSNEIQYKYTDGSCLPNGHDTTYYEKKAATCIADGNIAYWHCKVCDRYFGNEDCTNELSQEQTIERATGFHSYKTSVIPATMESNGSATETCSKCGEEKSKTVIYAVKTAELSKTSYTYNGKAQKPSVTVKDSRGRALKNNVDYTVSFPKGLKNAGRYIVTITLKGHYRGTISETFDIVPKGTSISKVTAKKKGFTVKWKKQEKQTTGYEIAYSTSNKFAKKSTKITDVGKSRATSKTVSSLKAKKKYYVRIRTYKTAKANGKSIKIYSGWSKSKTVTVKK